MNLSIARRLAAGFNRTAALPFLHTRIGSRLLGGSFATIEYIGRRSGRHVTLPVNYRRRGDGIVVAVAGSDVKTWWRNFTGEGAPLTITMGAETREGHGRVQRDAKGRVSVRIALAPAG